MSDKKDVQLLDSQLTLPLLPLKDIVIFPHMIVPVFISEDLCTNAVEFAMENQRKIFLSAFQMASDVRAKTEQEMNDLNSGLDVSLTAPFDVYDVGTVCTVMRTRKLPDGRMKVLVQGLHKAKISQLVSSEGFPMVRVQQIFESKATENTPDIDAVIRSVRESLEKVVTLGKVLSPDILMVLEDISDPSRLADLIAANLGLKVLEAQKILAVSSPFERLQKVHAYLAREIEVFQMQVRIQSQAKEEINRMQREHYLREQMKAIRTELGDSDGKEEIEVLWKRMEEAQLSDEAKEEVSRQIKRLERMHQDTSEASLTRTHIDTILSLPWKKESKDNLNLNSVAAVLDEDHYGLDQVKDRIVEFMAVKKLNPSAKSPIICFVGPPGVGKTSLGKSIAKSMGRSFARIALGGVRDEADIRGHRKTYVGAFPGRVVSAMKQAQTNNPVIMLDEIDKLGSDHRGDPSSALLEVLDPEQNKAFVDHYIGVSFDLSNVMFIANANTLETIPAPLRDRLEIIEVSGYSEEEKLMIANQYLIPKQIKEAGLIKANIQFSKNSVSAIINGYTRESGLRGLEKQIASVCRKLAREYAEKMPTVAGAEAAAEANTSEISSPVKLTPQLIQKHLGHEKYSNHFFYKEPALGVAIGLAYTQFGGDVLAIETNLIPSAKARVVLTGQLGDVMKESAQTALSFLRSRADEFGFDSDLLDKNELHVHLPAGGIPKDGPSAGITLATSMLSALLGQIPQRRFTMTGEITLNGKVLPIGGLREKLLASLREGITQVIVPEQNRSTFESLPAYIKKKVDVKFVSKYQEVFALIFETEGKKTANNSGNKSSNSSRLRAVQARINKTEDLAS